MKTTRTQNLLAVFGLAFGLTGALPLSAQANSWTFDASLYGVAAGMSGDMTVKGIPADIDVEFDKIWDNLKFGAMGSVRAGYGRWSLSTDVIYMDLGASKGSVRADMQQWLVQPMLGYTISRYFEVTAGARYNNLSATIEGTGPLGVFRSASGTVDWWDPVIGARISVPLVETLSLDVMGDVGGFGVGSDLTWQALPTLNWRFSKWASVQAGYRLLYSDYSQGSGNNQFGYDILTHGPQIGFTFHF
jgi:hypothetical protein